MATAPLHHNGDAEKGHATYHANGSDSDGAGNNNSYLSAQDGGGAPFNLRNVTPGGHPLDRVRALFASMVLGLHLAASRAGGTNFGRVI